MLVEYLIYFFTLWIFRYSRESDFVTATVSVAFSFLFTVPFFTAIATVNVPFFSLTVRSVKRTEPLILNVLFLVFDRESYRTKIGTVYARSRLKNGTVNKVENGIVRTRWQIRTPYCINENERLLFLLMFSHSMFPHKSVLGMPFRG